MTQWHTGCSNPGFSGKALDPRAACLHSSLVYNSTENFPLDSFQFQACEQLFAFPAPLL